MCPVQYPVLYPVLDTQVPPAPSSVPGTAPSTVRGDDSTLPGAAPSPLLMTTVLCPILHPRQVGPPARYPAVLRLHGTARLDRARLGLGRLAVVARGVAHELLR